MKKDFFNKVLEAHRIGINESVSIRPNDLYDMLYWVTDAFDERFLVFEKTLNDSPAGFLLKKENADLAESLLSDDKILAELRYAIEALGAFVDAWPIKFTSCEILIRQVVQLLAELKRRGEREEGK
jgi:hypothetical protein